MADYWEAAWNGYLFRGDFFGDLYDEALKPYYKYALEQLAQGQQGRAGSEASRGRLAQHLGLAYWRGIETLGEDNSIIEMFFNLAPDDVRANFINYLEGILQSAELSAK
jgi:hypothetical protein